jgi:hypothetical protein
MSAGLVRRIEKLEEAAARERASKGRWRVVWIDPVSGDRIDSGQEGGATVTLPYNCSEERQDTSERPIRCGLNSNH